MQRQRWLDLHPKSLTGVLLRAETRQLSVDVCRQSSRFFEACGAPYSGALAIHKFMALNLVTKHQNALITLYEREMKGMNELKVSAGILRGDRWASTTGRSESVFHCGPKSDRADACLPARDERECQLVVAEARPREGPSIDG